MIELGEPLPQCHHSVVGLRFEAQAQHESGRGTDAGSEGPVAPKASVGYTHIESGYGFQGRNMRTVQKTCCSGKVAIKLLLLLGGAYALLHGPSRNRLWR